MSAWTSGVLGTFKSVDNIKKKLDNFLTERKEYNKILKSNIQLHPKEWKLKDGTIVLTGTIFDEYVSFTRRIVKKPDGKFEVKPVEQSVDTRMGRFYLTTNSIVLAECQDSRSYTFRVISKALSGHDKYVQYAEMDIMQIARDYRKNWLGSITRRGHWQSGTLWGDDLASDSVVGAEFVRSHKNQIGIETSYFGGVIKVRITKDGSIVVYANLDNKLNDFVDFIKDELLRYIK